MKSSTLFAFVLTISLAGVAHAGTEPTPRKSLVGCVQDWFRIKLAPVPVLEQLPHVKDLKLPRDFIDVLRNHPIYDLREKYRSKQLIVMPNGLFDLHSGESIQGRFVVQVLQEVFSNVRVKSFKELSVEEMAISSIKANADPSSTFARFNLSISDSAEGGQKSETYNRTKGFLEMPVLKPANATSASIDRQETRRKFGIPSDAQVLSLYTLHGEVREILEDVRMMFRPEVIFVSQSLGMGRIGLPQTARMWAENTEYRVLTLSELKKGDIAPGKHYVVVNDTRGRMPYLHAASNLTVVRGPINMFESLNVGTPTLVIMPDHEIKGYGVGTYDEATFLEMTRVAEKTGASRRVQGRDAFVKSYLELWRRSSAFTRPYLIRDRDGNSPVHRMLDHLQEVLKEQGIE